MKICLSLLLCAALLAGCRNTTVAEVTAETAASTVAAPGSGTAAAAYAAPDYVSRFDCTTKITLSDDGILVDDLDNGNQNLDSVFVTHDIIYYEDRDAYESGNPYGEGTGADKHTAEEASAHTVVNITKPGAYQVSGKLSAGQIRIDLGEDAYEDPDAVVELILHNADITCTVAPAILFLNTYECDGNWSTETANPTIDTTDAGANLILEGSSTVNGAYVAKIYKDKDGEKKLWKQDGAIYSYMSMNVFGPGALELNATNEGLDTELHLTINGGDITIHSGNDGINTNEDGVSVTTINGGNLAIFAGLGEEGDGIDSNGYLVINGGNVLSSAKPMADAGLDSDLGSYIHGGTVIAMGSTMDWAESDSKQVTINLQFAQQQAAGSEIRVTTKDGTGIFSISPSGEYLRDFSGLILSAPALTRGQTYNLYVGGVQMTYTGNDLGRGGPGGFGGRPDRMPEEFEPGERPEDFDPSTMEGMGPRPDSMIPPEGFNGQRPGLPEGETFPEGEIPQMPQNGFGGQGQDPVHPGEPSTEFYMNDMVNSFSGVTGA